MLLMRDATGKVSTTVAIFLAVVRHVRDGPRVIDAAADACLPQCLHHFQPFFGQRLPQHDRQAVVAALEAGPARIEELDLVDAR